MNDLITIITQPCVFCGELGEVTTLREGYELWKAGAFIQDVLPMLSAGERELLISGTHDACWDKFIPDDED